MGTSTVDSNWHIHQQDVIMDGMGVHPAYVILDIAQKEIRRKKRNDGAFLLRRYPVTFCVSLHCRLLRYDAHSSAGG